MREFSLSQRAVLARAYHVDGLRVDAVASMLYLDYSRKEGDWIPNRFGGRENLEAIDFLRRLNEAVYARCNGTFTMAEESTAWPMVSRPTYVGGLGFGFKWNMGWMHDTLRYMSKDPVHRKLPSRRSSPSDCSMPSPRISFCRCPMTRSCTARARCSAKMPGDRWQKFANLRGYLAFMYDASRQEALVHGRRIRPGARMEPRHWARLAAA